MTTLTSSPAADVLERLFADAQRTGAAFRARMAETGPARTSREFFAEAKDAHLAIRRPTANLLYLLARTRRARTIAEFGTSFGVSTLCLAAAVRDNGGGRVIGTEYEPAKAAAARATMAEAGLGDLVEVRDGDALESLARDLDDPVDLVFLDGAKEMYLDVLRLLEPRLAPEAIVVADNASQSADFLAHVRDGGDYIATDVGNDVEVALRVSP
ncbi:O-methyltransferase [Amycolatopsis acidicola]|uniref:O-methyltransferase n=1 Tax=Amycolatopsis acidicola TaxID=2596893 RepID=A0A5N0UUR0_9PSEU|nr:class I SAM-dependent methyltransferase [Amycolatopsis acidicola]KAA9155263.1 O-methyltransferase [Amycolatopsis acidicola]